MRAIIETVFDIFYLATVLTVGIRMIRGSKSGSFSCRNFSVGRKRGILNSTNRNLHNS